jgi:hypothetical protein
VKTLRVGLFLFFALAPLLASATLRLPSEKEKRAAEKWAETVRASFDFDALTRFLQSQLAEQTPPDGFDFAKSPVGHPWKLHPLDRIAIAGEWIFVYAGSGTKFELRWNGHKDRDVVFRCERAKRDRFRLLEMTTAPTALRLM